MTRAERRRLDRPAKKWIKKQVKRRPGVKPEVLAEEFSLLIDMSATKRKT
jgi:hypothetical protein